MPALTVSEADALGRAILALNEPATLGTLPARVFAAARLLVGHEFASVAVVDRPARRGDAAFSHPMPRQLITPELASAWFALPAVASGRVFRMREPASVQDHMTPREFEASLVYRTVYQPLGLACSVTMTFDTEGQEGCFLMSVARGNRPFTATERGLLALLQPHLRQRRRHLLATEPAFPVFGRPVPLDQQIWLLCRSDGAIIQHAPAAPSALRKLGLRFSRQVPEEWAGWLRQQLGPVQIGRPPAPLPVQAGRLRRLLYCLANAHSGEHRLILLPDEGAGGALSERQQDIVRWIAAGKTNAEIGDILAISPFTVKNHVANILQKLGASSRAAVAALGGAPRSREL